MGQKLISFLGHCTLNCQIATEIPIEVNRSTLKHVTRIIIRVVL